MTEQSQPAEAAPQSDGLTPQPAPAIPPPEAFVSPAPAAAASPAASGDRPEIAIGGAFAGGLVLALILKRLAQ